MEMHYVHQIAQFFTWSKTDVLHALAFKYFLHSFSETVILHTLKQTVRILAHPVHTSDCILLIVIREENRNVLLTDVIEYSCATW